MADLKDNVLHFASSVGKTSANLMDGLGTVAGTGLDIAGKAGKGVGTAIGDGVKSAGTFIRESGENFSNVISIPDAARANHPVSSFYSDVASTVVKGATNAVGGPLEGIGTITSDASNYAGDAVSDIGVGVKTTTHRGSEMFSDLHERAHEKAHGGSDNTTVVGAVTNGAAAGATYGPEPVTGGVVSSASRPQFFMDNLAKFASMDRNMMAAKVTAANELREILSVLVSGDADNEHLMNASKYSNEIANILRASNGSLANGWETVGTTCTSVDDKVKNLLGTLYNELTAFCEKMSASEDAEDRAVNVTLDASSELLGAMEI